MAVGMFAAPTGRTCDILLFRPADGFVWNGSAFVSASGGSYATYLIAAAEVLNHLYQWTVPAALPVGVYYAAAKNRATAGTPANADLPTGTGLVHWDGTAVVPLTGVGVSTTATAAVADKILGRNLAGGSDGGRMVKDALRASRNKVIFDVPSAGQFTVMAEDDVTPAWTGTYSRSGSAVNALTAVDPA